MELEGERIHAARKVTMAFHDNIVVQVIVLFEGCIEGLANCP